LGMFTSGAVVSVIYILAVSVTVGVVPAETLAGSLIPLSQAGGLIWPKVGFVAMSVAAILAFVSTANAGILAASRVPLAMSRDGLLPRFFSRVNKRKGTPIYAILFTSLFIGAFLFMDITLFVKSASAMKILLFTFSIVSLILLRESHVPTYQPIYRSPLYPWLHGIGIAIYIFLLIELGSLPLLVSGAILGCGFVWFTFYGQGRSGISVDTPRPAHRISHVPQP